MTEGTEPVDYRFCWVVIETVGSAMIHAAIRLPSVLIVVGDADR